MDTDVLIAAKNAAAVDLEVFKQRDGKTESQQPEAVGRQRTEAILWFDSRNLIDDADEQNLLERVLQKGFAGVYLYPENLEKLAPRLGARTQKILSVEDPGEWEEVATKISVDSGPSEGTTIIEVVASNNLDVLAKARDAGFGTCYRAHIEDAASLYGACREGTRHEHLLVSFEHTTNIPLEIVIADLQARGAIVIKETKDFDDAIIALGVLEVGADGVLVAPTNHGHLDKLLQGVAALSTSPLQIEVGSVVRTEHLGLGYRSCVDTTTLFSPTEGILVGSTSSGGILCCPEVFFLPYMELRPFRVNAGAVHSYVYNFDDRTDYMSELRSGSEVMVVSTSGQTRRANVGRVKTEVRPLMLVECEFSQGRRISVIMQDDWHVRIFSDKGLPLNITDLKPGDKILGHVAEPGRHVGIKVDESILEC